MTAKNEKEKLNWWPLCWVTYFCSWLLGNVSFSGCAKPVLGRVEGCLVAPAGPFGGMCLLWRSPDLMLSYLKTLVSIYIFCRVSCILSRSTDKLMSLQSHSKKWEVFFSSGVPWTSIAVTVAVNERREVSCSLQRVIKHLKHLKDNSGVWALEQGTASGMAET